MYVDREKNFGKALPTPIPLGTIRDLIAAACFGLTPNLIVKAC